MVCALHATGDAVRVAPGRALRRARKLRTCSLDVVFRRVQPNNDELRPAVMGALRNLRAVRLSLTVRLCAAKAGGGAGSGHEWL
ncbi:hypothetical protein HMN09_01275800 [Mycena chlorophos]|uniref:Uncharacterized protein n=1 Tax=Mycena chlorophos TaxID=658473 RepID=A0A8H6VT36_MYCCL|nr:hypothetical protein HMN09_01275800 [Mycena chlorophos]